jgi:hypothetical protein
MLDSIYTGITVERSHQERINVIGNNVANVNTIGFKGGRATFSDVMSKTLSEGSSARNSIAATNPKQTGLGVQIGSIDTIMRQGTCSGEVFEAGIQHDIGKLVLSQYFPTDFGEILDVAQSQGIYIGKAEELVLGVTHADVGGWLAERWNLPDQLEESISNHHTPGRLGPRSELTSLIHLEIFSAGARTSAMEEETNCPHWIRLRCAHSAFTKILELPSSGCSVMATNSEKRWRRRMPSRPSYAATRMTACPVKTGKRLPLPNPHSWAQPVASRTVARLSNMIESIQ